MNILIIGTINGLQNEGMRNVITHLANSFKKEHEVTNVGLRDMGAIIACANSCDIIIVCARANLKTYLLCKLIESRQKNLYLFVVQKPSDWFIRLSNIFPLAANYLTIYNKDIGNLRTGRKSKTYEIPVGINQQKFLALKSYERNQLKKKYGFDTVRPVVLHVGHCSAGRGLEDFCLIDQQRFQCVIASSGLFESRDVVKRLNQENVRLITQFLPNIEELYQLADVYFFPTKSTEFVISVPLSVMEALACGTPVVAYRVLSSLSYIKTNTEKAFKMIDNKLELTPALEEAVLCKSDDSLLANGQSWDESAREILKIMEG